MTRRKQGKIETHDGPTPRHRVSRERTTLGHRTRDTVLVSVLILGFHGPENDGVNDPEDGERRLRFELTLRPRSRNFHR